MIPTPVAHDAARPRLSGVWNCKAVLLVLVVALGASACGDLNPAQPSLTTVPHGPSPSRCQTAGSTVSILDACPS